MVDINDIWEASARLETQDGDDVIGVYQFRVVDHDGMTDEQALEDVLDIVELIYTAILAVIPVLTVFRDIYVRSITQALNFGTFGWPTLTAGTGTGNDQPPAVAALGNFQTGVSHVTLRKYWGNIAGQHMTAAGLFNANLVEDITDAGVLMLLDFGMTNGDWEYGYDSPKTLGWIRPGAFSTANIPAYQRRRKQGRGS